MSTPRVSSNRNRKQSRKERESERKKKMRRSLVDTIMSRIHTSAALSDGPRGDPRRSETIRAPPRQTSLISLRDHTPRASRFRNDPRDTRTRSAPRPIGEHGATFRQIVSSKESDQKHAPGQSPRPPPRRRRKTWFKDKLAAGFSSSRSRARERDEEMETTPLSGQKRVQISETLFLGKNNKKTKRNTDVIKKYVVPRKNGSSI